MSIKGVLKTQANQYAKRRTIGWQQYTPEFSEKPAHRLAYHAYSVSNFVKGLRTFPASF
jgi:hypothetical protein